MSIHSVAIAAQLVSLRLQHQRSFEGQLLIWFRLHHPSHEFWAILGAQACLRIQAAWLMRAARTHMRWLVGRPVRYAEIARRDRRQRCLLPGVN